MINIFKKKKVETKEIVIINGFKFTIIEAAKLPNNRRIPFFLDAYKREWGIGKEDLLAFVNFMQSETKFPQSSSLEQMNSDLANKLTQCYSLLSVLESVLKEDYQYKPFLRAASYLILLEGEKINELDPTIQKKKMDLCQEYPEIEAFFLTTIYSFQTITKSSLDMSKLSNWYPSKTLKLMESSLYKKIHTTIYEISKE